MSAIHNRLVGCGVLLVDWLTENLTGSKIRWVDNSSRGKARKLQRLAFIGSYHAIVAKSAQSWWHMSSVIVMRTHCLDRVSIRMSLLCSHNRTCRISIPVGFGIQIGSYQDSYSHKRHLMIAYERLLNQSTSASVLRKRCFLALFRWL